MTALVPVDNDPFADAEAPAAPAGVSLTPVDHDPFEAPTWGQTGIDAIKSLATGAEKGVIGMVGAPGDVQTGAKDFTDWLATKLGMDPDKIAAHRKEFDSLTATDALPTSQDIAGGVQDVTGPMHQPETTTGKFAQSIGTLIPTMGRPTAGNIARFAVAPGVASEAAGEAVGNTALPDWAKGLIRSGAGMATSAIGPRAVSPLPVADQTLAGKVGTLQGEGVPVSAGDATNRPWLRRWENDLNPDGNAAQAEGFTQAALARAGTTRAPGQNLTGQGGVVDNLLTDVGNRFDGLQARNRMEGDTQLGNDLVDAQRQYMSLTPPSARAPIVGDTIHEIGDAVANNGGALPGDAYQALRSRLSRAQRGTNDPQLGAALGDISGALDDTMERSIRANNPADLGAWQQARRDYRNALVVEKAAGAAGGAASNNVITPANLASATKAVYGKRAYVRGTDDFSDLAQAGTSVMKTVPDSGTAQRNRINDIIKAIGATGASIGGALAGAHMGGGTGAAEGGVAGGLGAEWSAPLWEPIARAGVRAGLNNPATQAWLRNQRAAGAPGLLSTPQGQMMGLRGLLSAP